MMDLEFAANAVADDELWDNIHHHREIFTRVSGVDYAPDIRRRITLIPPETVLNEWRRDYETMQSAMIYGDSLPFEKLIERISELQDRFRQSCGNNIANNFRS
jgi:hypothetical protein